MNRFLLIFGLFTIFCLNVNSQIVSLSPSNAAADDEVTLTFKATEGNAELVGANKVYMHHGVVVDAPDGTAWTNVVGNWGQDDGVGEMQAVDGEDDTWQITFSPSIREYFDVAAGTNIFRISAVFRSADGSIKGSISDGDYGWGSSVGGDFFINLNSGSYITLNQPAKPESFINQGDAVLINATASSDVTEMKIFVDEGNGYEEKQLVNSGTEIEYSYVTTASVVIKIKVTAVVNGENLEIEDTHSIIIKSGSTEAELPAGLIKGINYHTDETKVSLVLEAPGKEFVFAVGDFNNWSVSTDYQMNKTPDGELFWIEIENLEPKKEYVFQYWIDGEVKVGDPYADKVADPWNDHLIEPEVYPNLPEYRKTEHQTATVLQTGQAPYEWAASEATWERPELDHLMIYELHIRDFIADHSYATLIDSLDYIKRLGINAIELMPVNEFEGNDSWGYNPSYYFAPDKYYGPKNELKRLIETAHQKGMAVIMDMVLNHAYGQNALVKMYWENGAPSNDSPWFNSEYVGPYTWGYDFDHESEYTKAFIDRVNKYWIDEYHFDGYRFDFTKGFTNDGTKFDSYNEERINILKRMADKIWETDPEAYVILEHWGPANEETELADYGMKLWRNRSYDFVPAVNGTNSNNFNGLDALSHIQYFNSHDERRIAEHALTEGRSNDSYDVKEPAVMYERVKMAAAFAFLNPGPKMMWQFDELGYDIHIDFNGRVGRKPLPWGDGSLNYYANDLRQYIYDAYVGILDVRSLVGPDVLAASTADHKLSGAARRLSYDSPETDLVVVGNFGIEEESIAPNYSQTGKWYNYFSGEELNITDVASEITLQAGEWHIFTTEKLSYGKPGVVEVYQSPVTVSPYPFTKENEITITFDATKASNFGTNGLVDAEKVYMHSGVTFERESSDLSNVVGNNTDDGVGEMTKVSDNVWEITLTPSVYYGLSESDEIFKIGMHFRDANNENLGYGFREQAIYLNVISEKPFITIEPAEFTIDDEVTITFDATVGNGELVGAEKVYMHSGVVLSDKANPTGNDWANVVGNWGDDDGVGEMTEESTDKWQITLTPKTYYELADDDFVYWIASVFRSAGGDPKGTIAPGEYDWGKTIDGGDNFIKNENSDVSIKEGTLSNVKLYPNPTNNELFIGGIEGLVEFQLFNISGKLLFAKQLGNNESINTSDLKPGMYIYQIKSNQEATTGRIIKH